MSVIEVLNLNKKFKSKQVLKNVSFSIEEGEILGFIGPNGAGKTTTIKCMLGLQSIDSGNVLINGFDINKNFEKAIAKVGAIVESPDLYMYLTGRKNLELIARMYNDVDKKRIDEVIKISGLGKRIDDKVSKYSLGMRQRLGIAAALLPSPNVLILDEPTNGLDPEGIMDLRNTIKKLATKEHVAVLISSHNLLELESFITNACIIKNGEVIASKSIEELKNAGNESYIIEVDSTKNIEKVIDNDFTEIDSTHVEVVVSKNDLPEVTKKLIKKDYKVYEIKSATLNLEEIFLNETGGNEIV